MIPVVTYLLTRPRYYFFTLRIANYLLSNFHFVLQKEMYWRIWLIRKIAMMSCTAILAYYAYKFEDYNKINNELLKGIQQQNLELKSTLESYGTSIWLFRVSMLQLEKYF